MRPTPAVLLPVPRSRSKVLRVQDDLNMGCRSGQSWEAPGPEAPGDGTGRGAVRKRCESSRIDAVE